MKPKYALLGVTALTATALTACGGTYYVSGPPPAFQPQELDTAQILSQAQRTSETSSPYQVDGGALTLTDTSETSEPISVNAGP